MDSTNLLNIFDFLVLFIMVTGGYFGFHTGILASMFYVLSGFAGMWTAEKFSTGSGASFYLVFVAGASCVIMVGFVLSRIFKKIFLRTLDKAVGAVLGLLLGLVIVGTVVLPVSHHLPEKTRKHIHSSFTGSHIIPYLQKLYPQVEQFKVGKFKDMISLPKVPDKVRVNILPFSK